MTETTTETVEAPEEDGFLPEEVSDGNRENYLNDLLIADPADVVKWKAADRDAAIFALLQTLVGEHRALNYKLEEFERWLQEKREQFSDPEEMKKMMNGFLAATPFGGMLG